MTDPTMWGRWAGLALALTAGCSLNWGEPPPPQDAPPDASGYDYAEVRPINRDVDILFVIDNSRTMLETQLALGRSFPSFVNVLNQIDGGLPNVHIGVVTTDVGSLSVNTGDAACRATGGDNGNLQWFAPCPITGNYVSDILIDEVTGMRMTNYTGTLEDAFGCVVGQIGDMGCGFEQPLEAMKRALNNNPVNAGFLRPTAKLAVIFVGDEDDCSATNPQFFGPDSQALGPLDSFRCFEKGITCAEGSDVALREPGLKTDCTPNEASTYLGHIADFATFLRGVKDDDVDIIVAAIAGERSPVEVGTRVPTGGGPERADLVPSCTHVTPEGVTIDADPAIRLGAFLEQFPDRHVETTVCNGDLSDGLQQIADLIRAEIDAACLPSALADVDPDAPGVQPDCRISLVRYNDEQLLPACNASSTNQPCWYTRPDERCTDTPMQLELDVIPAVPAGWYLAGVCAVLP